MEFLSRADKIVRTLASQGMPKSEGDVNQTLVRVLTADCETELRTLLYRDELRRAEIENIVRQRHRRLPVTGGNEGQALWTSRKDGGGSGRNRNDRKPRNINNVNSIDSGSNSRNNGDSSSNSSDRCKNSNISNNSNSSNSSSNSSILQSSYDSARGKCVRCLEPGYLWQECTACVSPVVHTNRRYNASEKIYSFQACCWKRVLVRVRSTLARTLQIRRLQIAVTRIT